MHRYLLTLKGDELSQMNNNKFKHVTHVSFMGNFLGEMSKCE